ncbi:MAG TPA: response regulator [Flavisolibacter sp.]|jgi:CheY-like chemotaxis protein|nr:response regulator [Flavisolibacter sp.]
MTQAHPPRNIVFYADDDQDDLELVREAFHNYSDNVEVITATDGAEALSYLKNINEGDPLPCIIILDINMPVLNGKDVLMKVREMDFLVEVPVILFSTSSNPMDELFARRFQAHFITKPIVAEQMGKIADRFIEHCTDEIRAKIRRR